MKRYEEDDIMTCYFVIYDDGNIKIVRGWSDNKEYAQMYLDFHKCKHYRLKKMTDTCREVVKILEENYNDEIELYNLSIRDKNGKKGELMKSIVVPMTNTEHTLVNEEINEFMASRINYGYINEAFYYLKSKYQKALKAIFLEDVMKKVVYEKHGKFVQQMQLDELMVLYRSLPDQFGS